MALAGGARRLARREKRRAVTGVNAKEDFADAVWAAPETSRRGAVLVPGHAPFYPLDESMTSEVHQWKDDPLNAGLARTHPPP